MFESRGSLFQKPLLLGLIACFGLSLAGTALAQDSGYTVGEEGKSDSRPSIQIGKGKADAGPVRLARFSYLSGGVTWRGDDAGEWSSANINLPMRQGAQISVAKGGRAEIQFDDGTLLRLGSSSVATLQTLYSDSEGEFTEIKMTDGIAALRIKHDRSIYQVDTPLVSLKASGPAKIRVGVGDGVEVGVRQGKVNIEGDQGSATLEQGDYLDLQDSASPYDTRSLPKGDTWEKWNDDRDQNLVSASDSYRIHNLPENIAIAANDLDSYGTWRNDSRYGNVWCPRVTSYSNWRPYHYGRWTYVEPFGWTWVSDEAWGWAPYHYGTWVNLSYGWSWVPGPVNQYWSPAVVSFSEYDGNVSWCPLAPLEVRYPSLISFGFYRRDWYSYFSIGQAACYYPTYGGYCAASVYNTTIINRVTVNNYYNSDNSRSRSAFGRYQLSAESDRAQQNNYAKYDFVPSNSRHAAVTSAGRDAFGGRGTFRTVAGDGSALFSRGRVIAQPLNSGNRLTAGPVSIRPTAESFTPGRSYVAPVRQSDRAVRSVYQAPLAPSIARTTPPVNSGRNRATEGRTNEGVVTPVRTRRESGGITRTQTETGRSASGNETSNTNENATGKTRQGNRQNGTNSTVDRTRTPSTDQSAAERARESLRGNRTRRSDTSTGDSTGRNATPREASPATPRGRSNSGSTETPTDRRRTDNSTGQPASRPSEETRQPETPRQPRRSETTRQTETPRQTEQPRRETRQPETTRQTETPRQTEQPRRETRQPDTYRQAEPRRETRQPEPTRQAEPRRETPPTQDRGNERTDSSSNPTTSRGRRP